MIGRILGNRYEIIEKIGEGGMALVYKAKCKLLDRFVAIKVLKDEFTEDEDFVRKFRRESQAAASLSHPNILNIYDVGVDEEDGKKIYYIVMEYIKGKTLKEIIKEKGKLSKEETINYSLQIAEALSSAHRNHIVHRDIKPHNIMVTDDSRVKVTDFGIARAVTSSTVTTTSNVLGSVHYFSPEQARGGYTDEKSDIYSLGIVMYEMITGKVPYESDSPISVALKHVQEEIVPPREIDPLIPANLEAIILKCVQKRQSDRYNNINELIYDLKNIESININQQKEISNDVNSQTRVIPAIEIEGKDNMAKSGSKKKNKNKKSEGGLLVIFAAILLAFLLVTGIFFGLSRLKNLFKTDEVPVPYVVGMDQEIGKNTLKDLGLNMKVTDTIKSSEFKKGEIISQSVDKDMKVKKGYTIEVTVSEGENLVKVPIVLNRLLTEAEDMIQSEGLALGKQDYEPNESVPANTIIRQYPDGMTEVQKGTKVNLVISEGPEVKETIMIKLIGMPVNEARNKIIELKLIPGETKYEFNNEYAADLVIWQEYEQGTKLETDTSVDLIISKGPDTTKPVESPEEPSGNTGMGTITLTMAPYPNRDETQIKIYKRYGGISEVVHDSPRKASDGELTLTFVDKIGTEFDILYDDVYQQTKIIKSQN